MRPFSVFGALLAALLFISCNKDGVLTRDMPPEIELDSETGVYAVKVGRELEIAPAYRYADGAGFSWIIDGARVSGEPSLRHTWTAAGDVFVTLRVETAGGSAEEELKVEVLELTPPVISLAIPSDGLRIQRGAGYTFAPDIKYSDTEGFAVKWIINGVVAGTGETYTFSREDSGSYELVIEASNEDGVTRKTVAIEVLETLPRAVSFPASSYFQTAAERNVLLGRPVCLKPLPENFTNPEFAWSVDGVAVGETGHVFRFVPAAAGDYTVRVEVTEGGTAAFAETVVRCVAKTQDDIRRTATAASSATQNKVYEYVPAPGQFIGETETGGFTGLENTPEDANSYAAGRLAKGRFVSLGGFGGYVIVGFDHSIAETGDGYDFAIESNAFAGSSEPGVVWVMQDTNQNGLPDDEWYELRGSETGVGAVQDYAVTYFRPAAGGMNTQWTDSEGGSGHIDHLDSFHAQDFYYPAWIEEDSYTLRGTMLPARNTYNSTIGKWYNGEYGWGYAKNFGEDMIEAGDGENGGGQRNGFKISNAVYPDGTPAGLRFIDFIKVQTAVNSKSGWLGEVSTEICSFTDLSLEN